MNAIEYSAAAKPIVDAFEVLNEEAQMAEYWGDDAVTPVRSEIKQHYIEDQDHRCVYCNKLLPTDNNGLWDAEHIISRSSAPKFMFEPRNLAVSCRDCNVAKGNTEVRRNPRRKSFPPASQHYRVVHPHFDNYSDHIRWFGDVCAPTSEKGSNTVVVCDLMRFTARIIGINGKLIDPDFDALVGKVISAKTQMEALTAIVGMKVHAETIPQDPANG